MDIESLLTDFDFAEVSETLRAAGRVVTEKTLRSIARQTALSAWETGKVVAVSWWVAWREGDVLHLALVVEKGEVEMGGDGDRKMGDRKMGEVGCGLPENLHS